MQETTFPYEVIVGEDGSTDGTREICIRYAEEYPDRIRLFPRDRSVSHLQHKGRDVMLNHLFCLVSARGKYLALCEGDDYWTDPLKLQKQVDFLEANPEYVLVHGDVSKVYVVTGETEPSVLGDRPDWPPDKLPIRLLLGEGKVFTPTVCARREDVMRVIAENPFEFSGHFLMSDTQLWLELARRGRFHYISDVMATMHRLPESASESQDPVRMLRFRMSQLELREHYALKLGLSLTERRALLGPLCHRRMSWAYDVRSNADVLSCAEKLSNLGCRLTRRERVYELWSRGRLSPVVARLLLRALSEVADRRSAVGACLRQAGRLRRFVRRALCRPTA